MRKENFRVLGIQAVIVWSVILPCLCAETSSAPGTAELISRLADPSFAARERASALMLELARKRPEEVERALTDSFRNSPDPEIRFRSKSILTTHYSESIGFLGVQFTTRKFLNQDGEMQDVVSVIGVAPDSPAKTGGLLPGDLILAVNGKAIDPEKPEQEFSAQIKQLGAGSLVVVSLTRGAEKKDLKVTLGKPPVALSIPEAEALFTERFGKLDAQPAKR